MSKAILLGVCQARVEYIFRRELSQSVGLLSSAQRFSFMSEIVSQFRQMEEDALVDPTSRVTDAR